LVCGVYGKCIHKLCLRRFSVFGSGVGNMRDFSNDRNGDVHQKTIDVVQRYVGAVKRENSVKISSQATFEELGLKFIDKIELLALLESALKIELSNEEMENISSLPDFFDVLKHR